ncbi:MAG: hypothetical protein EBV06_07695 [Planctomycetia bacterium]|nr:hypothetical protein [Planctomycetia bacterium]
MRAAILPPTTSRETIAADRIGITYQEETRGASKPAPHSGQRSVEPIGMGRSDRSILLQAGQCIREYDIASALAE